tara:strand:- start:432 stop:815 length:384 start_codon:yes stop_codon:yes gene_type:complete
MIKQREQQNHIPEFEDRINNPQNYPFIDNGDGTKSTHRMAHDIDNDTGEWWAYPMIVNLSSDGQHYLHEFADTAEGHKAAKDYAIMTGDQYNFGKDEKKAFDYASGGYKLGTPLDPSYENLDSKSGL